MHVQATKITPHFFTASLTLCVSLVNLVFFYMQKKESLCWSKLLGNLALNVISNNKITNKYFTY